MLWDTTVQFSWPRGMAEKSFTKLGLGNILSNFPKKTAKQSSLNFLESSQIFYPLPQPLTVEKDLCRNAR